MTLPLRRKHPITARNIAKKANKRAAALVAASALLAAQAIFSASIFADTFSDGAAASHATKLQWQPYRPARSDENATKTEAAPKCDNSSNCDETPNHDRLKGATSKTTTTMVIPPPASVKHVDPALAEEAAPASKVQLAAAEEVENAPALVDPFGDRPTKSVLKHRQAVAVNDADDAAPAQIERESPPSMRLTMGPTKQTPAELQAVEPTLPSGGLPGRSVKVFQGLQPVPGPESLQPNPPDTLPESSTKRALQNPAEDCRAAYNLLRGNTLDKVSLDIKVSSKGGDIPYECSMGDSQFSPRCWQLTTYTWKASCLCHKPLYFEEEALERYGHSHGWICEDFVSCAHFFGNVALLPYHVGVETPCECIYDLGVYRAGDCAPYTLDPFPISLRGAVTGAVGYGAVVALLP